MAEPLSALFDGERHLLEPDEHFSSEGSSLIMVGFEALEDDELSPFESALEPIFQDKPASYKYDNKPVNADLEQSWGSLSIQLSAFANVCGFQKKQYQENVHGEPPMWSFQTDEFISERM